MYPVDYNGVHVLTTEQLAAAYECEPKQIKQNFNNNKEHFKEGKHFFKLEGEALSDLRVENIDLQISPRTRCLYLWTRRGASRHCKMLGTEKAWEMYDNLEENYFNPPQKKMTAAEILSGMAEELVKQERRTARLEMRQERNEENFKILNSRMDTFNGIGTDEDKRQKLNSMIRAFSLKAGMRFDEGGAQLHPSIQHGFSCQRQSLDHEVHGEKPYPEEETSNDAGILRACRSA